MPLKLHVHRGDDKPSRTVKKKPKSKTKPKITVRSKAKAKEKKKRRLTKLEREFTQRWHLITDEIFNAAVEIWGDESDNCWRDLARAANLSYVTVEKLGERITRFPHLFTIDKLAQAVGGEVLIKVNALKTKQIAIKHRGREVA